MKTPSLAIGLTAVAFGVTLTLLPSVFAEDKDCKIMVQGTRVVMPATELTSAEETELNGILKNYKKSLYKIVKFENGVKVAGSEEGLLEDKYICEEAAIVKAAQASKASGMAIQIAGFGCQPACQQHYEGDDLAAKVEQLLKKHCEGARSERKQ